MNLSYLGESALWAGREELMSCLKFYFQQVATIMGMDEGIGTLTDPKIPDSRRSLSSPASFS